MLEKPLAKWILLGVILLGLFLSSEGSRSYWKRKRFLKHVQTELSNIKIANDKLSLEIGRLKSDPRAVEKIARNELGLIKPGEIEYRFISDHSDAQK